MDNLEFVEGNLVRHIDHDEWGIGSVEEIVRDRALVRFYAPEETVRQCPLAALRRHRYTRGDQIFAITENTYGIVQSAREFAGMVIYQVLFGGRRKGIPETNIRPTTLEPELFDLLRDSDGSESRAFLLALQARRLQYAYRYDELVCLSNARIELLPHQVFVADRVLRDEPHRFLLSDEVGLGKTIEAGLILKELRARGSARRVLIIAPAGLVSQWVYELHSKFNERFTRIDSTNIAAHIALCGGNVEQMWQSYPSIVTSLHMLRTNERYIEALLAQEWDLVIFDEAHHLRRYLERRGAAQGSEQDERRMTAAYRLAQRLQQRTYSLLLLTATPLQLHAYELYSLVELLDPALFPTYQDFEAYRAQIPRLNSAARQLARYGELTEEERWSLAETLAGVLRGQGHDRAPRPGEILARLETEEGRAEYEARLSDTHRLTRVLIRNRKRQVFDDLQPRVARILHVEFSDAEWEAYNAVSAYLSEWYNLALRQNNFALGFVMVTYRKILTSSSYALRRSFQRRIERLQRIKRAGRLIEQRDDEGVLDDSDAEELDRLLERYGDAIASAEPALIDMEIGQLHALCELLDAITIDSKAQRLLQELANMLQNPEEKVLIFTQFTETLFYLQRILAPTYQVCIFHGDMDSAEKDQAVDDFRDTCQVMIATEAAGEGRNLQFCHIMVNYDLPWNPMRIEQRIGRIDRIGQRLPVEIFNFAIVGTLEERVLHVLHERINIFESVVGTLDPILESIEQDVRRLIFEGGSDLEERTRLFEQRVAERAAQVRRMEERLADFLLDTSSFRRDRADALLGRTPAFTGDDLRRFLARFLDYAGGQLRERSAGVYDLTLPRHLLADAPDELRDSYRATFDAAIAQRQERLDFLAFGHPALDRVIERCLDERFGGRTAHIAIVTDELPAGPAFVAIYEFVFEGVRSRRELRAFAASLAGTMWPGLSERFLDLTAQAEPASLSTAELAAFDEALDRCRDTIEAEVTQALSRAQQQHEVENRRQYERTYTKLERYYAANRMSLTREIERLQRLAEEQQQSIDPHVRRIAPATLGRAAASRRARDELDAERDQRLSDLGRKRVIVAAHEILAVAYVVIRPSSHRG